MATKVIKDGTIVTADLTYKADVKIEDGKIIEIGQGLSGDETLDATGCYVMPGGIDPHTHLEMPFMGTYSSDDFESGTRAALAGRTTMVVDFALPNPGESLLDALKRWDNKSTRAACDYSFHMAVTWWSEQVFDEMETVVKERGINTFKHFLAYKGALMVNDDELYSSFMRLAELGATPMVHAENGDVVAELSAKLLAEGNTGPEAHAYSRPPQVEGEATNRAIMIADMAGAPLYVVHVSCEESHEAIRRAKMQGKRVWGEPLIQHLTLDESEYFNQDWDHAARRVMSPRSATSSIRTACGPVFRRARFPWSPPTTAPSRPSRNATASATSPRSRTAPAGWRIVFRCSGPTGSKRADHDERIRRRHLDQHRQNPELLPEEGAILVGADADIMVLDPAKSKTITADTQQSSIDYNVFEGKEVSALPAMSSPAAMSP